MSPSAAVNAGLGNKPSGPPPFVPQDLNPYGFWEGDYGLTYDGSNLISDWSDRIAARNLTQGTAANKPLYIASDAGFNNKPVVHLNSSAKNMLLTGLSIAYPISLYVYWDGGASGYGPAALNGSNHQMMLDSNDFGANVTGAYCQNGSGSSATPSMADTAAVKRSNFVQFASDLSTVTLRRKQGASAATSTSGANARFAAANLTQLRVGRSANGTQGKMAAFLVFTTILSATDFDNLHAYFYAKYG